MSRKGALKKGSEKRREEKPSRYLILTDGEVTEKITLKDCENIFLHRE